MTLKITNFFGKFYYFLLLDRILLDEMWLCGRGVRNIPYPPNNNRGYYENFPYFGAEIIRGRRLLEGGHY